MSNEHDWVKVQFDVEGSTKVVYDAGIALGQTKGLTVTGSRLTKNHLGCSITDEQVEVVAGIIADWDSPRYVQEKHKEMARAALEAARRVSEEQT